MAYMLIGFILFNGIPYMKVQMPMDDIVVCRAQGQKMEKEIPKIEKGSTVVWMCVNVIEAKS